MANLFKWWVKYKVVDRKTKRRGSWMGCDDIDEKLEQGEQKKK